MLLLVMPYKAHLIPYTIPAHTAGGGANLDKQALLIAVYRDSSLLAAIRLDILRSCLVDKELASERLWERGRVG